MKNINIYISFLELIINISSVFKIFAKVFEYFLKRFAKKMLIKFQ